MMVSTFGELTDIIIIQTIITISKLCGTKITTNINRMQISFTQCRISGLPGIIKQVLKIKMTKILTVEYSTAIITICQIMHHIMNSIQQLIRMLKIILFRRKYRVSLASLI